MSKDMTAKRSLPLLDAIMAYEDGALDEEQVLDLFAELVRSGMAWRLQGHYGRTAARLIEAGLITPEGRVA